MSNKNKSDFFTLLAFLLCGWWLISCCFKVLKWIVALPKHQKHSNKTDTTSWQKYIPECDTKKAIKIEGCLNVICRFFAWFTGILCIILLIVTITIDSSAWKPGVAFGVFALLFYFFSKNTIVKNFVDSCEDEHHEAKNKQNIQFSIDVASCNMSAENYTIEIVHHCSRCETEIKKGMNFCPGCGDSLEFLEDPKVKIKNGKVFLEGENYEKRIKEKNLKIDLPTSLHEGNFKRE